MRPGNVYDAHNRPVPWVLRCNTENGQILQLLTGPDGKPRRAITGKALTREIFVPYPVKIVFAGEKGHTGTEDTGEFHDRPISKENES